MENEVSKSAVQYAKDAHFREDASRNGNVTLKALDACSLKRIKVCNCVHRHLGSHCLLCEYNNLDRLVHVTANRFGVHYRPMHPQ